MIYAAIKQGEQESKEKGGKSHIGLRSVSFIVLDPLGRNKIQPASYDKVRHCLLTWLSTPNHERAYAQV
jgi:hypothetical protein